MSERKLALLLCENKEMQNPCTHNLKVGALNQKLLDIGVMYNPNVKYFDREQQNQELSVSFYLECFLPKVSFLVINKEEL